MKTGFFLLLVLAVFISGLCVVTAQHDSRKLFVEIQSLEKLQDGLNEEWTRLLLEQSTWATESRIENISRNELDMITPGDDVMLVLE